MTRSTAAASRALVGHVVSSLAEAERLAGEWDALASTTARSPFGLPGTALPWWSALGKGALRIATARSAGGDLVGLAAAHARRVGPIEVVRPLGHGAGAIASTLVAPAKGDVAGVLLDGLLAGPRSVVHLVDAPLDDPLVVRARQRDDTGDDDSANGCRAALHDTCPVVDLAEVASSADLLSRPTHRNLRKMLARVDRSLEGRDVRIDEATGPEEVASGFERLTPLFDAAEAANPRAHFGRGALGDFFVGALAAWSARGQVSLLTLVVDGRPAAFDVYVHQRDARGDASRGTDLGTAWAVLGRYDPAAGELSPGHLLLRGAVDWAIARGIGTLDLQLGSDRYKTRWATGAVDTFEVLIGPTDRLVAASAAVRAVEGAHRLRAGLLERLAR